MRVSCAAEKSKFQHVPSFLSVIERWQVDVVRVVATPSRKVFHRFVSLFEHHGLLLIPELPSKLSREGAQTAQRRLALGFEDIVRSRVQHAFLVVNGKILEVFNGVVVGICNHVDEIVGQVDGETELVVGGNLVILTETVDDGEGPFCVLPGNPKCGGGHKFGGLTLDVPHVELAGFIVDRFAGGGGDVAVACIPRENSGSTRRAVVEVGDLGFKTDGVER